MFLIVLQLFPQNGQFLSFELIVLFWALLVLLANAKHTHTHTHTQFVSAGQLLLRFRSSFPSVVGVLKVS